MYRHRTTRVKSSLSIFAQKYLCKFEDTTYFILQNKYLHICEDSFGGKMLRDDCTPNITLYFPQVLVKLIFFFESDYRPPQLLILSVLCNMSDIKVKSGFFDLSLPPATTIEQSQAAMPQQQSLSSHLGGIE